MTPEEIYADRFANAVVDLIQNFYSPNTPMSEEERASNKQFWLLIGKAIYRANTGNP